MNERIRELIKQAGYTEAYYYSDDGPFVPAEFNKEKFAELIVQECLDILDDEDTGDVYGKSVRLAMTRIKQHFGVEQ